jgi:short-subunit dehydrogenase
MEHLKKITYEKYGKVDILVNNATIIEYGSILDQSMKAWDNAFNVNVKATIFGIKLFLPDMIKRREGTIITMSTDEGTPYLGPYSATKIALQSLTLSLTDELDSELDVSVLVFAPGFVEKPATKEASKHLADLYKITEKEFINLASSPGYDGMMPAKDCAAGFAYTIVKAKKYCGQIADPFKPLATFGLLPEEKGRDIKKDENKFKNENS